MAGLSEWDGSANGAIQVVHDADRSGTARLTLGVEDLAAFAEELSTRGLTLGEIQQGDVASFALLTDPEGTTITVAELAATAG